MTAAYSQLTASMHCAPAGNLIGAAGAQALLQAVRSSTGRLTALDLCGEFAPLGAAGSYAIVTGHPFWHLSQQTGAVAVCAGLCSPAARQTTHSACRAVWQQVPAEVLFVMHHVKMLHDHASEDVLQATPACIMLQATPVSRRLPPSCSPLSSLCSATDALPGWCLRRRAAPGQPAAGQLCSVQLLCASPAVGTLQSLVPFCPGTCCPSACLLLQHSCLCLTQQSQHP